VIPLFCVHPVYIIADVKEILILVETFFLTAREEHSVEIQTVSIRI
jgi:hypothetical protein